MTDPLHTEPVEVTQADVHAAALQWCGEKDRETSLDDVRYFENNWQSLPGLRSRVEAFARHRTAAEAVSRQEVEALRQALVNHNDVLRSAYQIAARKGAQTEWEGFTLRAGSVLHFHHEEVEATRAALTASEGGEA